MKKILLGLGLMMIVAFSFVGTSALAASALDGCNINDIQKMPEGLACANDCVYSYGDCGMCCLFNSIYTITDWVFIILVAVSSVMIVYGGVLFTISSGKPEDATKARTLIIFAAVGIAVALLSRAIPSIVKVLMGV